jgi:lipopolysaccharide/colanic/teichoic acid biosynthesis glycosyltransferase
MSLPNVIDDVTAAADAEPAIGIGIEADKVSSAAANKIHAVAVRDAPSSSGWLAEALYRIFELTATVVVLTLGLPVMAVTAILVRLDSPGPILFLHRRPSRSIKVRGRHLLKRTDLIPPPGGFEPDTLYFVPSYFTLPKFRTMYADARERFPELYSYDFSTEDFHKQFPTPHPDPRLTRVGAVLRKLSIDELPNLWSVLAGHLRLVGPRPEAPEVLRHYLPEQMYKFSCKPGITGLAQINGRGHLTWGETIGWDLKYLSTRTVGLDVKILLLTLKRVLQRDGAF